MYTELIRKIIKSEAAKKAIMQISPRYGNAYVFLWLLQAIGTQTDKISKLASEFEKQITPQESTWSLSLWGQEYAVPMAEGLTDEERRRKIISKMISAGPMNPARLSQIAEAESGYPARIDENTGVNTFDVYLNSVPSAVNETKLRSVIDVAKPARLIYNIKFERYSERNIYLGGYIAKSEQSVTLSQKY